MSMFLKGALVALAVIVAAPSEAAVTNKYYAKSTYCKIMQKRMGITVSDAENKRYLAAASTLCALDLVKQKAPSIAVREVRSIQYGACEWLDAMSEDSADYHTYACNDYWESEKHWYTKHPIKV